MDITLITKNEIELLINSSKEEIVRLERLLKAEGLKLKLFNHYNTEIQRLKGLPLKVGSKGGKLDHRKILLKIFKDENELLTTLELYQKALKLHPDLSDFNEATILKKFSNTLTALADKKGLCHRFEVKGNKGKYWGLKEFFVKVDHNPVVIPGIEYNEKLLERGVSTGINREYYTIQTSFESDERNI